MSGPMILFVCIQNDLFISHTEEFSYQQTQAYPAQSFFLVVLFTDLDADFGDMVTLVSVTHLADQNVPVIDDQPSSALIVVGRNRFFYLFRRRAKSQRKAGMGHDASVIPPLRQLFTVFLFGIPDADIFFFDSHQQLPICPPSIRITALLM